MADLYIYYDSFTGNDYIDCYCSRWDTNNYEIVIETWIKKTDLQTLRDNITPNAVGELYNILGRPKYYDKTWSSENTLKLKPNSNSSTSNLNNMRREKLIYVKNITDSPIKGANGWFNVKIEGYVSGSTDL